MTHISRATAQRELADLVTKGILRPNPGKGRSASYDLVWDDIRAWRPYAFCTLSEADSESISIFPLFPLMIPRLGQPFILALKQGAGFSVITLCVYPFSLFQIWHPFQIWTDFHRYFLKLWAISYEPWAFWPSSLPAFKLRTAGLIVEKIAYTL